MVQCTYKNLLPTKILMPLKQNACGRGNKYGVRERTSVHLEARDYSQSIHRGSGKNGTIKGNLPRKVPHICTLFLKKTVIFIAE